MSEYRVAVGKERDFAYFTLMEEKLNDFLKELNPEQQEAVIHGQGPLLILAGAGSGKTRVLTYRIAFLVAEKLALPENILGVTFTNKAAGEMKERVGKLLGVKSANVWLSTFHSFCAKILRQYADRLCFSRSFTIYDEDDQTSLISGCIRERDLPKQRFSSGAVLNKISSCKNVLVDWRENYNYAHDYFDKTAAALYQDYQTRLEKANAMDFDDLLMLTVKLFRQEPQVLSQLQDRFQYLLVDEYQDTNHAQYMLLKLLAEKEKNLAVVGDDDQSIYGWRGADLKNILDFERDYPNCKVIRLEQNYRSTQKILDAAWSVVKNNLSRKDKKLWTENESGERIKLLESFDEKHEALLVVDKIRGLSNKYKWSDFVILYRTNAQSRVLEQGLRDAGIPYVIVGGVRFYERKEIKDVLAFLKVLTNPKDDLSLKRIVKTFGDGVGEKTLSNVEEFASRNGITLLEALQQEGLQKELSPRARKTIAKITGWLNDLDGMKNKLGLDELVEKILEKTGYLEALTQENTEESLTRAENLKELVAAVREFKERTDNPGLENFLEEVTLITDIDQWDDSKEAVTLMTLHAAKGLEFSVVFMVGLEEGLFPLSRSLESVEQTEEERRLFYVGCTRAKNLLFLSYARMRSRFGQMLNLKSRFLDELPEELIETEKPEEKVWETVAKKIEVNSGMNSMLRVGCRIIHPTFGYGEVVGKDGAGENLRLTVIFRGGVKKRLLAKYADLEIVG